MSRLRSVASRARRDRGLRGAAILLQGILVTLVVGGFGAALLAAPFSLLGWIGSRAGGLPGVELPAGGDAGAYVSSACNRLLACSNASVRIQVYDLEHGFLGGESVRAVKSFTCGPPSAGTVPVLRFGLESVERIPIAPLLDTAIACDADTARAVPGGGPSRGAAGASGWRRVRLRESMRYILVLSWEEEALVAVVPKRTLLAASPGPWVFSTGALVGAAALLTLREVRRRRARGVRRG